MFPTAALYLYLIWIPTLRRSQRRKSMRQCDQSMIWVWDCGGSTVGGGRLLRLELEKDFLACFPPRILGLNIILYFSTKSFVFDICHNLRQESWERRRQLKHWPASSKTRLRGFLQRRWLSLTSWLSTISLLLRYRLWYRGAYQQYPNLLLPRARWKSHICPHGKSRRSRSSGNSIARNRLTRRGRPFSLRCIKKHHNLDLKQSHISSSDRANVFESCRRWASTPRNEQVSKSNKQTM